MSMSSLASCASDSTSLTSNSTASSISHLPFDKCPRCCIQYDIIKRTTCVSSKVPLILSCKHTVCEHCISKLITSACSVCCPICKEMLPLPREYHDRISEYFTPHYSLIGYLMWVKNPTPRRSFDKWISTGVTLNNMTIEPPICDYMQDDSNTSLGDSFPSLMEFEKCPTHNEGYCNVKCDDCEDIVCCYCFLEDHIGHKAVYLYKLNDAETLEINQFKSQAELILKELELSKKKVKELGSFDISSVERSIRNCFTDLHAKLHIAEKELRSKLSTFSTEEPEFHDVKAEINLSISRVSEALKFINTLGAKQANLRGLYQLIQELRNVPCRLVADCGQSLNPIQFMVHDDLNNFGANFILDKTGDADYSLVPIKDWNAVDDGNAVGTNYHQTVQKPKVAVSRRRMPQPKTITQKHKTEDKVMRVVVTHLNCLESFYVQICTARKTLNNITANIARRNTYPPTEILLGHVYGVLYKTKSSEVWRRGKVAKVYHKNETENYHVFFIDYGNTQIVTADCFRLLTQDVAKRPPFAYESKLSNPGGNCFDENARLSFTKIIDGKELDLKIVAKFPNGVQEVDLFLTNPNGQMYSVKDTLLRWHTNNGGEPQEPEIVMTPNQCKLFNNSKMFTIGLEEQVIVTYIRDPTHICVQQASNIAAIEKLKEEMNTYYHNKHAPCVPLEGTEVIVRHTDEDQGNWHRARINSVNAITKMVNVYFVDWGGYATVSWSSVRVLTEKFTKMECQGVVVRLAHVDRKNTQGNWDKKAIDFLDDQIKGKCFKLVISSVNPLEVVLFQRTPTSDLCMNALLVEHDLAVSTGTLSETVMWSHKDTCEENLKDDENDVVFQMIKVSEKEMLEFDDPDLKDGLRQHVEIAHIASPYLIYIRFRVSKEKEDQMHKEIQIHYNEKRRCKKKWKPSEYCIVFDSKAINYFRGVIKSEAANQCYVVYLYDHVRELTVPNDEIFIQETYFSQFRCWVYKCCLDRIRPAGDSEKWSSMAVEALKKICSTYRGFYIKKTNKNCRDKLLHVVMWYTLTISGNALEPSKTKLISINSLLIDSGLAFSKVTPVSVPDDYEEASSESTLITDTNLEPNSENSEPEVQEVKKDDVTWYELILQDEGENEVPQEWPKLMPLENATFDAKLVCLDSQAVFVVRDVELDKVYQEMERNLKEEMESIKLPDLNSNWKKGNICLVRHEESWYRGTILQKIDDEKFKIEMIDFGSEHEVHVRDIFKAVMYSDIAPLINRIGFYDVAPVGGAWLPETYEKLLKIVDHDIRVEVKEDLNGELPLAEIYLKDGRSVNNLAVKHCSNLRRFFHVVEPDPEEPVEEAEDPDQPNYFRPIPDPSNCRYKMLLVSAVQFDQVILNTTNCKVDWDSDEMVGLSEDILASAEEQPLLANFRVGQPCIVLHSSKKVWCRAELFKVDYIDHGYAIAFLVDYGIVNVVPLKDLREIKSEWFNYPANHQVANVNVELVEQEKASFISMQINNLAGSSLDVELVSEAPLTVNLYNGEESCYESFIQCGFVKIP